MNEILFLAGSYAIGCLSGGYYLVRILKGLDIRQEGSGSTGARNVSRTLGKEGFVLTCLLDGIKGVAVVWVGRALESPESIVAASILAVVCGHIWPIQLRFHGGKGIAPAIGALLFYDPLVTLISAIVFVVALVAFRNMTLGGLAAVTVFPVAAYSIVRPFETLFLATALAVLILFAHRMNLREEFVRMKKSHKQRNA